MAGYSCSRGWLRFGLILLGFLCLTVLLNVANPIWESIDEPGHFQYVKFVAEHHRLPGANDHLPSLAPGNCLVRCVARGQVDRELPLYYILEAPFVLPIDLNSNVSWIANPYFTWPNYPARDGIALHITAEAWPYHGMVLGVHVMRAVSGLMVLVALVALYFTALAIGWGRNFALLAVALAAITPGLLLTSASVNNDSAAVLTCSLALLGAVKALTDKCRPWLWFGLCLLASLLALASKGSSYFLLPVAAVLCVWLAKRQLGTSRIWASLFGVVILVGLVAIILWTPRYQLLATLKELPRDIVSAAHDPACQCSMFAQPIWGAIPNLWETWWGSYGWETFHPPSVFYRPLLVVTLLAAGGLALLIWRTARSGMKALRDPGTRALLLLSGALVTSFALVDIRFIASHSSGGTTHARFLFPAITAGAILLSAGLFVLPKLLRIAGFALLFSTCLALNAYSVYILPRAFGPQLPVFGDMRAARVQHQMAVDFSSGMRLVGWSAIPEVADPTHPAVHLRLFWEAWTTPNFDYSAFLHLAGPNGLALSGSDHGPGLQLGLLPHLWQPGEIIPDDWTVQLPTSLPAGRYQLATGVYDYRNLKSVPTMQGQNSVAIGEIALDGQGHVG